MQDAAHQRYAKRFQQLNSVKRFLQAQNPLMLIVGEKGSGKTNLLTDIVLQMRASRHMLRLQGHQSLHPSQLAKVLSKHWAIKHIDKNQRLENQLDQALSELAEHKQACILIVDDAHLLSLSMLAALTHLATQQDGKRVHLHLLLSGRPILSEKMNNLQTKSIPQLTVGALSRENAFRKIKSLLDNAGMTLPHAAANAILTKIYQRSGGMPGTLEHMVGKLIAQRATIDSAVEEKPAGPPNTVLTTTEYNFWQKNRVKTLSLLGLIMTGFILWHMQHHSTKPLTWPKDTIQFTQNNLGTTPTVSAGNQHKNIAIKEQRPIVLANTIHHTSSTIANSKKSIIITNIPSKYTLQLMSGTNEKALGTFIKQHHLKRNAEVMKTQYKGQDWYVLTYGHYRSPQKAERALKHLPKSLQQLHPWIRPANHLHAIT